MRVRMLALIRATSRSERTRKRAPTVVKPLPHETWALVLVDAQEVEIADLGKRANYGLESRVQELGRSGNGRRQVRTCSSEQGYLSFCHLPSEIRNSTFSRLLDAGVVCGTQSKGFAILLLLCVLWWEFTFFNAATALCWNLDFEFCGKAGEPVWAKIPVCMRGLGPI